MVSAGLLTRRRVGSMLRPHLLAVLPGEGAHTSADPMQSRLEVHLALLDGTAYVLAPRLRIQAPGGCGQYGAGP